MKTRLTFVGIYLAIYLPAAALRLGLDGQWDPVKGPDSAKDLDRRYWNDDLEPCIIKYCLQFRHVMRNYMHCIQKYCPSGLVTVPRDISNGLDQLMEGVESKLAVLSIDKEGAGDACPLFCQVKSSLLRKVCLYSKCMTTRETGADDSSDPRGFPPREANDVADWVRDVSYRISWNGKEGSAGKGNRLLEKIRADEFCGLLRCPTLHGAEFLDCVHERCGRREPIREPSTNRLDAMAGDAMVGDAMAGDAMAGDAYSVQDESDRTLKRKRRINDDVSQCIQSYCGNIGSKAGRLACIVRSCNRAG